MYPFLSYVLLTLIINRSMEAQDTQNVSLSSDPYLRGVIDRTIGEAGLKQLQNARVIFSNIVNKSHNKRYIINKIHGETPHFPLDWDLYSIFKAHARILMTSGTPQLMQARLSGTRRSISSSKTTQFSRRTTVC